MESNDSQTTISDEDRRLAEAKKLTLQPLHSDIAPEPVFDTEIAARHLSGPAIGNVGSDIEQNTAPMQPSKGSLNATKIPLLKKQPLPTSFIVTVILAIGLVFGVTYFALAK